MNDILSTSDSGPSPAVQLRGRRVLVIGLGMSGEAAAVLCSSHGAIVTATDLRDAADLAEVIHRMSRHPITYRLGVVSPDVTDFDLIIRSPGVANDLAALVDARGRGIPIWSEIELAYHLCPCPVIAVTGTNGKGTTTTLIAEIMRATGRTAHLVGNIGTPFAAVLPDIAENDIVVLEISAAQLENSPGLAPATSVITNICPEHRNLYSWPYYISLKSRVVDNHTPAGSTVVSLDDRASCEIAARVPGRVLYVSTHPLPPGLEGVFISRQGVIIAQYGGVKEIVCGVDDLQAVGAGANVPAAVAVGLLWKAPLDAIRRAITQFRGREHVLEYVGEKDGVRYYNDAKATNPYSTRHALNAFGERSVVLIAGGHDNKDVDLSVLGERLADRVIHLVAFGPTAQTLVGSAQGENAPTVTVVDDFTDAISVALRTARPGQNVLFSPSTYSPNLTPDYLRRGEIFKEMVEGTVFGRRS